MKRIKDTGKSLPKIDYEKVAKALGATLISKKLTKTEARRRLQNLQFWRYKMDLRWDEGYWLEECQCVFPSRKSAMEYVMDQDIEKPTVVKVVKVITTTSVTIDDDNCERVSVRAWVIKEFSGPYEFEEYEAQKDSTKIKKALKKLTEKEITLLGLDEVNLIKDEQIEKALSKLTKEEIALLGLKR